MSVFDDDLQYRNVAGTADLNDLVAPGNYFVEDVLSTNLPLDETGYLTVREQQGKTSLFQSYLAQQSSRLYTRTATGGFNGETDTLTIVFGTGETVTATITPRAEGLTFYAAGDNLNGFDSQVTGTDTLEGSLVLAMDTAGMGGITINGTNAIMVWGGAVMVIANTLSTDRGTLVIDSATANGSTVDIRFSYQWTAEMGRERTWSEWQRCYCNCPPAIQIVTISFDSDGGSPIPNTILVVPGQSFTVPAGPTKDDYAFNGWKAQGSGMVYQPGQTVTTNVNMHLVAQWEEMSVPTYTLSFDSDGGTTVPANIVVTIGMSAVLPAAPSKDDYSFTGWRDAASGILHQPGRQVTPASDMHFVAQWQVIGDQQEGEINVYFLTEGADYPILMAAEPHTDITLPDYAPQMEGHTFVKWLGDDFTTEYMPGDVIHMGTESIYLSAVWHIYESYQTTEKMLKSQNYLAGTVEISEDNLTIENVIGIDTGVAGRDILQIDWGDGIIRSIASERTNYPTANSYTYPKAGRYRIRVWGGTQLTHIRFKRDASPENLLQSSDVLISIDYLKTAAQGIDYFAANFSNLTKIHCPIIWKGAPNIGYLTNAFANCRSLTGKNDFTGHAFNMSTRGWTYMTKAFYGCISLDPVWSIKAFRSFAQLVSVESIFENCSNLTQAPVNFCINAPYLVNYANAFKEARSMKNLPVNIDLSFLQAGVNLSGLFHSCHSVEGNAMDLIGRLLDWGAYPTNGMFAGCTSLSDYDRIPARFL